MQGYNMEENIKKIEIESMQHAASFWYDLDRLLAELIIPDNQQQKSRFWRIRKVCDNEMKLLTRKLDEQNEKNKI